MTHISEDNPVTSRWRRLGVRTRLMVVYMTLMTVVIGAIFVQSDHVLTARLNAQFNRDLAEEGIEFTSAASIRPHGMPLVSFTRFYLDTHLRPASLWLIVALQRPGGGRDVLTSPGVAPGILRRASTSMLPAAPATRLSNLTVGDARYRAYATPILLSGRRVATLVAIRDLSYLNANRSSELTIAALTGLAALIASVIAGYLLLGRMLLVVGRVRTTAERAAGGDLSLRVSYRGPEDEVGRLAGTVDMMLERIDHAFSAQRRLLSDIAHQLRTPLTVIRGHLEVLARNPEADADERGETIALVIDELEHVSLMVERLLLLGRALEPDFVEEEEVDIRSLLEDVFDAAEFLAPRRWQIEPGPPLVIRADATKLRGALLNLLDNAVKATDEQDTIRLTARQDRGLILEVSDTGRGLSDAEQSRLFERFSRSSDRYRGSGLGLAIVKAVAEAHGGRVEVDSAPGAGARFRIVLPRDRIVGRASEEAQRGAVAG